MQRYLLERNFKATLKIKTPTSSLLIKVKNKCKNRHESSLLNENTGERNVSSTLISTGISVFLSFYFGFKPFFSWPISLMLAFVLSVASMVILAVTEQFWEKYLSLLISKFSENNFF